MRTKSILAAVLVGVTALAAVGAASAANAGHRWHPRGIHYIFLGQLTATPSNGGVSITVEGGNRPALSAMLGQPVTQTFAYGASTEFLQWSKGAPTVVQPGDLSAGDYVRVNVRAPRWASLGQLEATDASLVGDHGTQLYKPSEPLYLFAGTIASSTSTSVTVNVGGGNRHAERLLLGQSPTQTFTTGSGTIFLLWQGKVPTVISASQLTPGDRVLIRVRAARDSTLAQVEATAANRVAEHEHGA
jgi:hypothetical protein